jgi:acyl carrier protein
VTDDDVLAGLAEILSAVAGVDRNDVSPETTFADGLGIDSVTMIEVVVAAEDRFGVRIRDDDIDELRTVGDAADYISRAPVAV